MQHRALVRLCVCACMCVSAHTFVRVCRRARSREHVSASVLGITLRTKSHSAAVKPVAGLSGGRGSSLI